MKLIKSLKLNNLFLGLFCFLFFGIKSQDVKSAYFQVKFVSGYKYSGDLYLLTNSSSTVFRPYVLIDWGPQVDTLKFIQSNLYSNTVLTKFSGSYIFPGTGVYKIIYKQQFRMPGIKNILNSQSELTGITTTLIINPFNAGNVGPTMQNYPIYFGKNGSQAFYDPNFVDSNGDSLSYSITNCDASNYYLPGGVTLNPYGVLSFSKDSIGLYAFSYNITEWRKDIGGNYFNVGASQVDFVMDINSSIGISEIIQSNQIKVYPNPVSNILHIESEQYFETGTKIEITNALGQTVFLRGFNNKIDLTTLSSGYYTIKVISPNSPIGISKFIKE